MKQETKQTPSPSIHEEGKFTKGEPSHAEKAYKLIKAFGTKIGVIGYDSIEGKRLAAICVQEMIDEISDDKRFMLDWEKERLLFWQQVLSEIKQ